MKIHPLPKSTVVQRSHCVYRNYESYDEYVNHQKEKYIRILEKGGFNNIVITDYRLRFYRRFKFFRYILKPTSMIICAGARQGTEVEVLRDLGFKKAIGIDLNPGPNNPYVKQGDFMKMDFMDSSVDALYSNCVDHAISLEQFFAESMRVLKPDGYVCYDLSISENRSGGYESTAWKADIEIIKTMLMFFKDIVHVEEDDGWKWILLKGKKSS